MEFQWIQWLRRFAKCPENLRYLWSGDYQDYEMHFMAAVRFRVQSPLTHQQVNNEINAALQPFAFVRPMEDCYVVSVPMLDQYNFATQQLIGVAQRHPQDFYMLISPPMAGGGYTGWLEAPMWPEINRKTM